MSAAAGEFTGKVALVTGAGSGLGAATARLLAARGAALALADLDHTSVKALANEIAVSGGKTIALALDVRNAESVRQTVAAVVERFGALHLAVNNAGVGTRRMPVGDYDLAEWSRVIDINLNGVFYSLRHEVPAILAAGGGAIVNVASIMGATAIAGTASYVAAKHAVVGLTRAAALDYAKANIRINAIGPGYIDTPLLAGRTDDEKARIGASHPLGRMARPEEIAETIAYLLSDRSSFVTGAFWLADGGYTAT